MEVNMPFKVEVDTLDGVPKDNVVLCATRDIALRIFKSKMIRHREGGVKVKASAYWYYRDKGLWHEATKVIAEKTIPRKKRIKEK